MVASFIAYLTAKYIAHLFHHQIGIINKPKLIMATQSEKCKYSQFDWETTLK